MTSDALDARRHGRAAALASRHGAGTAFGIALVVMFLVALADGTKPFSFDAFQYWHLDDGFVRDGHWSLTNFADPERGYAPALFYGLLRSSTHLHLWDGSVAVKLFNSVLLAAIGAVLAPALAQAIWPQVRFGLGRRLAVAALLLVFWRGYLNFPLSDLPALTMGLTALVLAARATSWPAWLASGLAAGVAIDTRPAYALLAPALVVLCVWRLRRPAPDVPSPPRRVLVAALAGLAIVLVPQSLYNHGQDAGWSPLPGAGRDLTGFQLTTGLTLQRYETYLGTQYAPQLKYVDPHTTAAITDLGEDGRVDGYGEYAGLIVRHPIVMAGVFVRHAFNGIDQRYSTPYVERIDDGRQRPLRAAALLLAFLALLRLGWPAARRGLGPARWRYAVALALTSLPSLPSAVETRFMLPIFVLTALLVVAPGWPPPRALLGEGRSGVRRLLPAAGIVVAAIAFFAIALAVTGDATSNLQLLPPAG